MKEWIFIFFYFKKGERMRDELSILFIVKEWTYTQQEGDIRERQNTRGLFFLSLSAVAAVFICRILCALFLALTNESL